MKKPIRILQSFFVCLSASILLSAFNKVGNDKKPAFKFPYAQAGLTEREAAAHLLSRFTYGARPGQVDEVVKMGLENWFALQLSANQQDDSVKQLLSGYDALEMSNEEIVTTFPDGPRVLKMAIEEGLITREQAANLKETDKQKYKSQIAAYMAQKGFKPRAELFRQLINQKIIRASYSNNQLQEMLTAFWFNHFNISITKNESARFIMAYERDVIRPNALGKFEDLLLATARSPAMLTYLDNAKSMVEKSQASARQLQQQQRMMSVLEMQQEADTAMQRADLVEKVKKAKKEQGLNENYAREIMELHTMGVDGGYTQADVTAAARILTGWTVYPMERYGKQALAKITQRVGADQLARSGYVHDGDFLFAANRHDYQPKHFLGQEFTGENGCQEGLRLIHMLAGHPSTAKFISSKLASRFVSDEPLATLVNKMAETFAKTQGDIKSVLITMTTAPEFWSKAALREKIKSPFELVISSVRAVNASVKMPYQLYRWSTKMGEELYHYQAPTGFPDKGRYWINTGSLLYRMNFGLAFAGGQIPGTTFNLSAINNNHEPESTAAAIKTYGAILMPERNMNETIKRLLPVINDPEIQKKIAAAADKNKVTVTEDYEKESGDEMTVQGNNTNTLQNGKKTGGNALAGMPQAAFARSALSQVIGILVGSPEFQRR